jgi:hypothetical protein
MAIKVSEAAKGNAPATGMQKTPAPTRQAPPDATSHVRAPTAQSYGENGPINNASRTNPGEIVESDLGRNMRESVDDDGALDQIIKNGVRMDTGFQTRDLNNKADKNRSASPVHPHMTGASKGGTVPQKLGQSAAEPVRKPGA